MYSCESAVHSNGMSLFLHCDMIKIPLINSVIIIVSSIQQRDTLGKCRGKLSAKMAHDSCNATC